MSLYLGLDTSNYTTSVALFDSETYETLGKRRLLEVKKGTKGLRQSEALFFHVQNLPILMRDLFAEISIAPTAIGVSTKPRDAEGSYMPCFLAGKSLAESLGAYSKLPVFESTHQVGHILAALYSVDKLSYINDKFIALHVSGGTTDVLLVEPDDEKLMGIKNIGSSLDLNAGQCVDRVGIMLGLGFPSGPELEKLALKSDEDYKVKIPQKAPNCSLSGLENLCSNMVRRGESPQDTAKFCLDYISQSLESMILSAIKNYGSLPLILTGGVMANSLIRKYLSSKFECIFGKPEMSGDNAVGLAVYAALKQGYRPQNISKAGG